MSVVLIVVLLVNAAFAFVVWPAFAKRVARDPRARDAEGRATPFLRVHVILFVAAFTIAALSAIAAVAAIVVGV